MKRWTGGRFAAAVIVTVLVLAGCGSSSVASSDTSSTVATVKPQPAGPNPSKSARMVCAPEANGEIAQALGVDAATISRPTWVDHLYSCTYEYPDGKITLSVKELSSAAETTAYFESQAAQMGRRPDDLGLGQAAFVTTSGSTVVRKDWKVLTVDITGLPPTFGKQHMSASDTGEAFAATILGCWSGS